MRYVNPHNYDYVSQFVPMPLEYMNNAIHEKQKGYDDNEVQSNALLDSLKIKSRVQDKDLLGEITNKYNQRVSDLVKDAGGDKGSSKFLQGITNLRRDVSNDLNSGDLYGIKNNKEVYDQWITQRDKQKNYQPHLDEGYFNLSDSNNPDIGYKGYKQNGLSTLGNISEYLSQEDKADALVKGIASEGGSGWKIQEKNGHKYIVNSSGEYVTPEKIKGTFLPLFERSEEFRQLQKEAIYQNKVNGTDTNDYINKKVNNLLQGVTSKYTASSSKTSARGDDFDKLDYNKKLSEQELDPIQHYPSELNPTATPENVELLPGVKVSDLFKKDKDGNLLAKLKGDGVDLFRKGETLDQFTKRLDLSSTTEADKKLASQYKKIAAKFLKTPFEPIMKSGADGFRKAVKAYSEAISEATSKDLFTTQYKNVDAQKLTDENVTRLDPETSNFIAADGTAQTLENAAASYNFKISNTDFSMLPKSREAYRNGKPSAYLTGVNTHSGALTMKLRNAESNEVVIPTKSSYEVSTALEPIKQINDSLKSGTFNEYQLVDGKKAKNVFVTDSKGNVKVKPRIYSEPDPNWETQTKSSLEKIIKALPEDKKNDKLQLKANLEANNPGIEIQINKDGTVNVRHYMSLPKYSDSKVSTLINEGYLPKESKKKDEDNVEGLNDYTIEDGEQ